MKRILLIAAAVACFPAVAFAQEPTLNDLPTILQKLRGCAEVRGVLGTSVECRIPSDDLWAAVRSDGGMTLFRSRSYGDTTYARGNSVGALLRDFAAKLANDNKANKEMLDALAPYLPTQ